MLSEAAARSGVSAAAATRSELSEIASGNLCGLEVAIYVKCPERRFLVPYTASSASAHAQRLLV